MPDVISATSSHKRGSIMRVLVTGGAGFLGSHLCDALVADGNSVVCADNLLTGRLENISHLSAGPRFDFHEQDVCRAFDFGKLDYIFHLASPASPVDYLADTIETLQMSSLGSTFGQEQKNKYGAQILLTFTSMWYVDSLENPQKA